MTLDTIRSLHLSRPSHHTLLEHGLRKHAGRYLDDEPEERKAYGLLGGHVEGDRLLIADVVPLRRNVRTDPVHREAMDTQMRAHAFPSETPFERRGWVADPREVLAADLRFRAARLSLVGTYHMHRVPWPHDPTRDACSEIDRILAAGSGLWVVILSLVDPSRPTLRAFYEGRNEHEVPVRVDDHEVVAAESRP